MEKKKRSHMKMAQLCKISGFSRQTIHSYLRKGILPPPTKMGRNLHFYDETHLEYLERIRFLRQVKRLSLEQINLSLNGSDSCQEALSTPSESFVLTSTLETQEGSNQNKGQQIIDNALLLFSERGFENVRISDITEPLNIGKGTFYLYFENKQELLLECFKKLRDIIQPLEQKQRVVSQKDFYIKMKERWFGFQSSYASFPGVLHLLRTSANSVDPNICEKAREAYDAVIKPLRDDILVAIKDGLVREDVDPDLSAHMLWGIGENMAFRKGLDDKYSNEEIADFLLDILYHLFRPAGPSISRKDRSATVDRDKISPSKVRQTPTVTIYWAFPICQGQ